MAIEVVRRKWFRLLVICVLGALLLCYVRYTTRIAEPSDLPGTYLMICQDKGVRRELTLTLRNDGTYIETGRTGNADSPRIQSLGKWRFLNDGAFPQIAMDNGLGTAYRSIRWQVGRGMCIVVDTETGVGYSKQ